MDLQLLNKFLLERVDHYLNLEIEGEEVQCPYFINDIGIIFMNILAQANVSSDKLRIIKDQYQSGDIPFGNGSGKGTPEEITEGFYSIAKHYDKSLEHHTKEGIRNFMNIWGLGIDCSGLVFEVFRYAFEKLSKEEGFLESLNWPDLKNKKATRANCTVFDNKASEVIEPANVQTGDIVLIRDSIASAPSHIAFFVEIDDQLMIAQSTPSLKDSGVNLNKYSVDPLGKPYFDFEIALGSSWPDLYEEGLLEFRRLSFLNWG